MQGQDITAKICDAVSDAYQASQALHIQAGQSKLFYGNEPVGTVLNVSTHKGIIDYEPSELFITARCGTSLHEIESVLAEHNQMLPFEPPAFGSDATIGGTIACGVSGPRRPYAGAARDNVLGTHIVNGKGEYLRFGGQVMKNVAGYDISRLMCGSFGTLGIMLQISLKVIPAQPDEITLSIECNEHDAVSRMHEWMQTDLPITGTYFEANHLFVRIAGVEATLHKVKSILGGTQVSESEKFWHAVKEQQRDFFKKSDSLWRLVIPSNSPSLAENGECTLEWNGGLRWLKTDMNHNDVFSMAENLSGHATLYRAKNKPANCFQPLSSRVQSLQLNMKKAFDPKGILNPGRMYSWC